MLDESTRWKYLGNSGKLPLPILFKAFRLSEVKKIENFYPRLGDNEKGQLKCYFYGDGWEEPHSTLQVSRESFLGREQKWLEEPAPGGLQINNTKPKNSVLFVLNSNNFL